MKKYRAVFFDAGGTLFKPHPSVGYIYASVASKYGMDVNSEEVEKIFRGEFSSRDKQISWAHASEKDEKSWWKDLVRDVFEKVTPLSRFDDFFDDLYDVFARAEAWKLYPDVRSVLDELKRRGFVLGVVSNWDSRLFSICQGMDLDRVFDFILASAVVGSAKPDAGIFREALRLAQAQPAEAIHIGDSVDNDYRGAQNVGIDALLINRTGRDVPEIRSITSFEEILRLT